MQLGMSTLLDERTQLLLSEWSSSIISYHQSVQRTYIQHITGITQ
jgi:hypothetical protein